MASLGRNPAALWFETEYSIRCNEQQPTAAASVSVSCPDGPPVETKNVANTGDRFTLGPSKVFLPKIVAILPITTAAEEMADFFTDFAQAGSPQKLAGRVTDHYDFGFGTIKIFLNTLPAGPNEAAPPLSWNLVMWIGSQLLRMTELGWTDHFAALFVDPAMEVRTFVTLQVVSAGLATIGYVDPATGQPIVPATSYFNGNDSDVDSETLEGHQ